jgi:hypothetical protein
LVWTVVECCCGVQAIVATERCRLAEKGDELEMAFSVVLLPTRGSPRANTENVFNVIDC